ncbi:hypothetical protein Hdeb2414_s0030g00707301 [Helianthus debilis subsp. tardiflorus]
MSQLGLDLDSVQVRSGFGSESQLSQHPGSVNHRQRIVRVSHRLHFQNYGAVGIGEPMGFRVLSRRSIFRSLSLLASAVQ